MSELKVYNATIHPRMKNACDGAVEVYLKSEADEVIAERDEKIERLEILCANYRHDCDNLAISNEQAKRAAQTLRKKMNHQKYKRCLAMAKYCEAMRGHYLSYKKPKWFWYRRWSERWLELAEKFKEAK